MTRIPLMAGNWKMNLDHLEATATVQRLHWALQDAAFDYAKVEVAVLAPFTDLRSVQTVTDADNMSIRHGAQDVSVHPSGAYTGEIAASMLAKLGCSFVVVGHSERRQYHGETDQEVGEKALAAFGGGMVPIICVGEALAIRKAGEHVAYTLAQLDAVFAELSPELASRAVVAYEPIWAIGTGEVATPADAQEVCGAIRERLAELYGREAAEGIRILYGGSVKSSNVAALMAEADVDGGLVGGASLDPEEFARICRFSEHSAA
ncbi:MAG: triose-phosphate isomerase [Bifidobacteriaceae bacterium]|jgi:triosephosphate isomerase|nr:triose-phosphate isomerase [Bifidobacteriaceae bacterium]